MEDQKKLKRQLHENNDMMESKSLRLLKKVSNFVNGLFEEAEIERRNKLKSAIDKYLKVDELNVILSFYRLSDNRRMELMDCLLRYLTQELSSIAHIEIKFFGSIMNGLALMDSDIDVYITNKWTINKKHLYNSIIRKLHSSKSFKQVIPIEGARVPIIKTKHISTGVDLDISVATNKGTMNSYFISEILKLDNRLHKLFLFIKIWGKTLKLINSYSLTILVIFFLQQPLFNAKFILPSIEVMQRNKEENLVENVNYSYDLLNHYNKIPMNMSVSDLVKKFFIFYSEFNFENQLIAPFLGKALDLDGFKNKTIPYPAYEKHLQILEVSDKNLIFFKFNVMNVQDPFELDRNITAPVNLYFLEYIKVCFKCSKEICRIDNCVEFRKTNGEIFKKLICELPVQIKNYITVKMKEDVSKMTKNLHKNNQNDIIPVKSNVTTLAGYNNLTYKFEASKREMQWAKSKKECIYKNNWYHEFVDTYIEAITKILERIYLIKIKSELPKETETKKLKPNIEYENGYEIFKTKTWNIVSNIDLWSTRTYQRQCFWSYQEQQTKLLYNQREKLQKFSVNLDCTMKLTAYDNNKGIKLIIFNVQNGLNTTLTKFFNNFQIILQNFNIKEELPMSNEIINKQ